MENWKAIPAWEGWYEVSDCGRVRSVDRKVVARHPSGPSIPRLFKGRVLRAAVSGNGYPMVSLTRPGAKRECRYVHALVLEAFIGPCPQGLEVCHNDGKKPNNKLDNLRYDTRKANSDDTAKHGNRRAPRGEDSHSSRLTTDDVLWIRDNEEAIRTGVISMRSIGKKFGVTHSAVSSVLNKKTWRHI